MVTTWLKTNGLDIDPDKTEFITFAKKCPAHLIGDIPHTITLHPPQGTLTVQRSRTVRYLGIFISEDFSWKHHIEIMAARA